MQVVLSTRSSRTKSAILRSCFSLVWGSCVLVVTLVLEQADDGVTVSTSETFGRLQWQRSLLRALGTIGSVVPP